ncbi:MAG TPA: hypothetical protein VEI94_16465 [Candidatus Bathyarchaeia archaeon]|nr:hypothetical protein [Candidatus Bathyarchaeia archaeon]
MRAIFPCGPLEVAVTAGSAVLLERARESLELYGVAFDGPRMRVAIEIADSADPPEGDDGGPASEFLACARMRVERTASGLRARCLSGVAAVLRAREAVWRIAVPASAALALDDLDELIALVLTHGWRAAGWTPVHAAAVERGGASVLLCAPSGGGKSTLTAGLVRRGWRTLGDDKLLLRLGPDAVPEVAGLMTTLNLDPRVARWFPELAELESLTPHSRWTDKRRIQVERVWPGRAAARSRPTHVARIVRAPGRGGLRVRALGIGELLSLLLHQTVVPSDREEATRVLSTVAPAARRLRGLEIEVGDQAYADPGWPAALETAIEHGL